MRLLEMLRAKYGNEAARLEVNGVDIVLAHASIVAFIEIKSQPDARLAIREALGQILEYALFVPTNVAELPELVIVAPGKPDAAVQSYLKRLNEQFHLAIRYVRFDEHTVECPL
jgi:hypothetical protein